jgi:hypothetical protein
MAKQTKTPAFKLEYSEDSIGLYRALRDGFYNPKSVLYSSSGFDASPSRVFANVTFVDLEKGNEGCITALQNAGLKAIKDDIRYYKPLENHDLLILLNPATPHSWATKHLGPGSFILANNYHSTASAMFSLPNEFNLVGSLGFIEKDRRKKDSRAFFSRDLENLFVPVKNEEELLKYRPDYHSFLLMCFKTAELNFRGFDSTGTFDEVWARYRELIDENFPSRRVSDLYVFRKK